MYLFFFHQLPAPSYFHNVDKLDRLVHIPTHSLSQQASHATSSTTIEEECVELTVSIDARPAAVHALSTEYFLEGECHHIPSQVHYMILILTIATHHLRRRAVNSRAVRPHARIHAQPMPSVNLNVGEHAPPRKQPFTCPERPGTYGHLILFPTKPGGSASHSSSSSSDEYDSLCRERAHGRPVSSLLSLSLFSSSWTWLPI